MINILWYDVWDQVTLWNDSYVKEPQEFLYVTFQGENKMRFAEL